MIMINPQEYTCINSHRISKRFGVLKKSGKEAKAIGEKGKHYMVLQEASFQDTAGNGKLNIERILANETGQESIRLSYQEKNSLGFYQTVSRPLEAVEDDIFNMIKIGIENRIISPVLQAGLKTVIRNTESMPVSWKPLKSTEYYDLYACGEILTCGQTICMERIFIKGINIFAIRLAGYRENANGVPAMVWSPTYMSEEEFLYLFQDSIKRGVFSKVFVLALLTLL